MNAACTQKVTRLNIRLKLRVSLTAAPLYLHGEARSKDTGVHILSYIARTVPSNLQTNL